MFHVGQHVVCVKKDPWKSVNIVGADGYGPALNEVCFVTDVGLSVEGVILRLRGWEVDPKGVQWAFRARRFRPLQDSRLDIFRQLLVNPPKQGVDA